MHSACVISAHSAFQKSDFSSARQLRLSTQELLPHHLSEDAVPVLDGNSVSHYVPDLVDYDAFLTEDAHEVSDSRNET